VRGTKQVLNYSRDHSVADSLEYVANWNAAMLLSNDIQQAVMASMSKRTAQFAD
jgi:enoyl-CoA hydratase